MQRDKVKWDQDKNAWLKANRGVSFEAVIDAMESDKIIDDLAHPARPHQRIMIVELAGYICAVPYESDGESLFLKTIYPDRKMKDKYRPESL